MNVLKVIKEHLRPSARKGVAIALIILPLCAIVITLFYYRIRNASGNLLLSGTVEVTEVEISPELSAKVITIHYLEGDQVKAGDPLLDLESSDLDSKLQEAKAGTKAIEAEVALARAKMENAKRDYNRNFQLYQAGAISASAFDAASTAYTVAKNAYEAALNRHKGGQSQVETINVQVKKTRIFSPISGVVLERSVEAGEVVFPGMVLMTVGDLRSPWVRVYISEPDVGKVRIGQQAFVATDAYPKRKFPGVLRYIASEAEFTPKNVQTRQERVKLVYEAKVYLSNEEGILKPGMPADVSLRVEE